jgi:TolA-binding protein
LINKYSNSDLVPDAYYWTGRSQEELGQKDLAIKSYTVVAERHSKHSLAPESLLRIGKIYSEIKDFSAAILTYNNLKSRYPGSESVFETLFEEGIAYNSLDNNQKAKELFEEAISKNPESIIADKCRNSLGIVYLKESNYERALNLFNYVVKKRIDEIAAEAQFHIGEVRMSEGSLQEAHQEFLKVKYVYPAYDKWVSESLLMAGECLEKLGQTNGAVKIYEEILKKHKDDEVGLEVKERISKIKK